MQAVTASIELHITNFCAVHAHKDVEILAVEQGHQLGEAALHIPTQVQGRLSLQTRSNIMQLQTKWT
jgi:hypothetical protein